MNKWITTLQFETEFDPTTLSNEEIASRGVLVDRDIEQVDPLRKPREVDAKEVKELLPKGSGLAAIGGLMRGLGEGFTKSAIDSAHVRREAVVTLVAAFAQNYLTDADIEHAITRAIKTVDKLAEHFPELRKADPKAKLFDLSELFDPSAAASDLGKKNL